MYRMGNQLCMQQRFSKLWNNRPLIAKVQAAVHVLATFHLRRRQIFTIFDPYPPLSAFFTTFRQQIWQIFDPSPTMMGSTT